MKQKHVNMPEIEEFNKMYREKEKEWFEKNFIGKPFHKAVYDSLREPLIKLAQVMCRFMFLRDGLVRIKSDKSFYKKLSKDDKDTLKVTIKGVDVIVKELDEILKPIADGFDL